MRTREPPSSGKLCPGVGVSARWSRGARERAPPPPPPPQRAIAARASPLPGERGAGFQRASRGRGGARGGGAKGGCFPLLYKAQPPR